MYTLHRKAPRLRSLIAFVFSNEYGKAGNGRKRIYKLICTKAWELKRKNRSVLNIIHVSEILNIETVFLTGRYIRKQGIKICISRQLTFVLLETIECFPYVEMTIIFLMQSTGCTSSARFKRRQ